MVLDRRADSTVTVAGALAEPAEWDWNAWPWIADDCALRCGLHLRARYPELVRRY
ncbi:hypothetical protein G6038_14265 [Rhodococcus sp. 14C212]|uniref:hypothetical protein n=1 Tax=Rhodococcus sp. 14C212 TaxID=2711209 RepID=UPI0013EE3324|nr:hypothetical protein [Rhodococcus sp. 14C212]NGP06625.1 hypothetical protein [Rhodococcus sp. 14C212]